MPPSFSIDFILILYQSIACYVKEFMKRIVKSYKERPFFVIIPIFFIFIFLTYLLSLEQEDISTDNHIITTILKEYFLHIKAEEIDVDFSKGIINGLDRYSKFLSAKEHEVFLKALAEYSKNNSVYSEYLGDGIGYLRIFYFSDSTLFEVEKNIKRINNDADSLIEGYILDLRNNPGGSISSAISIADAFLNDGLILITKGRTSNSRTETRASFGDIIQGKKLIVLSNLGSASAAEVLIVSLKENKRALIFGDKTLGKGTVQTLFPLPNDEALYLTTAYLISPLGNNINLNGVRPDIVYRVKSPQVQYRLDEKDEEISKDKLLIEALKLFN